MKKFSKAFFLLLFVAALFTTNTTKGQGLSVNLGAAYGFDVEEFGVRVGASKFLNENMRFGADITYWFIPSYDDFEEYKSSSSMKSTMIEFNAHFHYFLLKRNSLGLYGIGVAGLHYASFSYMGESSSDSEIGIGIGAGVDYDLGSVKIFAEPKYFFTGFDQFKVSAGVRISIGGK
jgi:hypothetical protein